MPLDTATPEYVVRLSDPDAVMRELRSAMYGREVRLLAVRTGLSTACLYKIRNGTTKWPRGDTFFTLCNALGYEVALIRPSF
jgi:DNA-binding Xre family transcriptional regulator